MHEVDAGVEQRNRDSGAGEPGDRDVLPPPAGKPEGVIVTARCRLGRDRSPHREHSPDVGVADDDREGTRVERRRKAVEHPVVRMLGLDRDAAEREAREDFALIGLRGKRPGPLLILGGDATRRRDPRRERRLREDDDPAPAELRRGPVAEQALPARRAPDRLIGPARSADEKERSGREQRRRGEAPAMSAGRRRAGSF